MVYVKILAMKIIDFSENKFLIVGGAGVTGSSIINYLRYKAVSDNRIVVLQSHQDLELNHIKSADVIVLSPGVFGNLPSLDYARELGKLVLGDIELFAREIKLWQEHEGTKVIGITGSNGKTTCATFTAYLASGIGYHTELAGNIGIPVLDVFLKYTKLNDDGVLPSLPQIIVLELSSYQLESTHNLYLDSATVLNISEDHLDHGKDDVGYGYSMLEYTYAKARIFNHTRTCVLNADDTRVCDMHKDGMKTVWFGSDPIINTYCPNEYNTVFDRSKMRLQGQHNVINILAGIALLESAIDQKISFEIVAKLVQEFAPLPHRINIYKSTSGNLKHTVFFVDDSKATNIDATRVALDTCRDLFGTNKPSHACHLILGGDSKGQNLSDLANLCHLHLPMIASIRVIGKDRKSIVKSLLADPNIVQHQDIGSVCVFEHEKLSQAIIAITQQIEKEQESDTLNFSILLAPACSSLDQYKSYAERGNDFVSILKQYYLIERWK